MDKRPNIEIQIATQEPNIPSKKEFVGWTKASLQTKDAEITIRIVDEAESETLNSTYRNKQAATNVLAFPLSSPIDKTLHGDIVICAPLVRKEAQNQGKLLRDHFAHLTVHGILHLQGYDHIKTEDAQKMEQQETTILATLGIPNPYD
jgi:probable rRNA maturation factor